MLLGWVLAFVAGSLLPWQAFSGGSAFQSDADPGSQLGQARAAGSGAQPSSSDLDPVVVGELQAQSDQAALILRLRQELITKEQRIEGLTDTLSRLAPAAPPATQGPVVTRTSERHPDQWVSRLNAALKAGGLPRFTVVELASLEGGVAQHLLISEGDGRGTVESWERATLVSQAGLLHLELLRPGENGEERRLCPLPLARTHTFSDTGLQLPVGLVLLAEARRGLDALLQFQSYRVLALTGMEDDELLGLQLEELDLEGRIMRTLVSTRARVLATGPSLLLLDGEVTAGGVTRPFYRGKLHLPLPGADYSSWLNALFGGP